MLKAVVFAAMLPMAICYAQADRAAVTGTITDQSHLAMASAHVRLVYPGTGLRRESSSSPSGVYHIGGLPIGECYLEVSSPGFRSSGPMCFLEVGRRGHWTCPGDRRCRVHRRGASRSGRTTYSTVSVSSLTSSQQLNNCR
jgi:hypothetical protein